MEKILEQLNPIEDVVIKEDEKRIFAEIAKIDGISELFRAYMSRDIKVHFNAQKDQQDLARGAFYRMEYLLNRITKNSDI